MGKPMDQRQGGVAGRHRGASGKLQPPNVNPARRKLPCGVQGPLHNGGYHGIFKGPRQEEAATRQAKRVARGAHNQLAELDHRLGVGVGARKERARLRWTIATIESGDELELL